MIQRIQSLYLLSGAALVVIFLLLGEIWAPLAAAYSWLTMTVLVMGGLAALLALVAVFFYKNRVLQRKVTLAAQWLVLILILLVVGGLIATTLNEEAVLATPPALYMTLLCLPVAYMLLHLARRGVEKDIALVRSMDRLR